MSKMMRGIAALALLVPIGLAISMLPPQAPVDRCKATETDVVSLYNSLLASPEYRQEPARTRMTAELVKVAENLCREQRDRKPTPLPAELQKLAR